MGNEAKGRVCRLQGRCRLIPGSGSEVEGLCCKTLPLAAEVLRMGCEGEGQERKRGGQLSRQQRRQGEGTGEGEE